MIAGGSRNRLPKSSSAPSEKAGTRSDTCFSFNHQISQVLLLYIRLHSTIRTSIRVENTRGTPPKSLSLVRLPAICCATSSGDAANSVIPHKPGRPSVKKLVYTILQWIFWYQLQVACNSFCVFSIFNTNHVRVRVSILNSSDSVRHLTLPDTIRDHQER